MLRLNVTKGWRFGQVATHKHEFAMRRRLGPVLFSDKVQGSTHVDSFPCVEKEIVQTQVSKCVMKLTMYCGSGDEASVLHKLVVERPDPANSLCALACSRTHGVYSLTLLNRPQTRS
jgi:hypothetical protein